MRSLRRNLTASFRYLVKLTRLMHAALADSGREKREISDTQPATWLVLFADDGEGKKQVMGKGKLERTGWVQVILFWALIGR